jgi:small subunit ribosomal protein S20
MRTPLTFPGRPLGRFEISDPQDPAVANIKSQIKRNKQNEKRRLRNKAVRSELRTRTKKAVDAVANGAEGADDAVRLAVKRIDKSATKGVIHKNQAARRKSRLMKRLAGVGRD